MAPRTSSCPHNVPWDNPQRALHGISPLILRLFHITSALSQETNHTADYDPFVKSQLASTLFTIGPYVVQIWTRNTPKTGPNGTCIVHRVAWRTSFLRFFVSSILPSASPEKASTPSIWLEFLLCFISSHFQRETTRGIPSFCYAIAYRRP